MYYLQLAICIRQVWRSSGKYCKFIGQNRTSEIRTENRMSPLGYIRSSTFGIIMLWKWPSFSFAKNKSGFHILSVSVNVRNLIRPFMSSYTKRSSLQASRKVIWIAYSICTSSILDMLRMKMFTLTMQGPSVSENRKNWMIDNVVDHHTCIGASDVQRTSWRSNPVVILSFSKDLVNNPFFNLSEVCTCTSRCGMINYYKFHSWMFYLDSYGQAARMSNVLKSTVYMVWMMCLCLSHYSVILCYFDIRKARVQRKDSQQKIRSNGSLRSLVSDGADSVLLRRIFSRHPSSFTLTQRCVVSIIDIIVNKLDWTVKTLRNFIFWRARAMSKRYFKEQTFRRTRWVTKSDELHYYKKFDIVIITTRISDNLINSFLRKKLMSSDRPIRTLLIGISFWIRTAAVLQHAILRVFFRLLSVKQYLKLVIRSKRVSVCIDFPIVFFTFFINLLALDK